jgi:hypothetical protein
MSETRNSEPGLQQGISRLSGSDQQFAKLDCSQTGIVENFFCASRYCTIHFTPTPQGIQVKLFVKLSWIDRFILVFNRFYLLINPLLS